MLHTILIVDDEPTIRMLLSKILSEYRTIEAGDGKEMWQLLQKTKPDLILLDIMLPFEDGLQIAEKLQNHEHYRSIPIIFLTARVTGPDVAAGFRKGCVDYIKKPFDEVELKARISAALKKKESESKLREETRTDSLTRIYNRRYFFDSADRKIEYCKRRDSIMALTIIDVDTFKKINDTYGHQAGDYILIEFAKTLQKNVRPYDLVARYGGEEFVILFLDSTNEEAFHIMERIRRRIDSSDFIYDEQRIHLTFSAGISCISEFDKNECTLDAMIKLADDRLYQAKRHGGNTIILEGTIQR